MAKETNWAVYWAVRDTMCWNVDNTVNNTVEWTVSDTVYGVVYDAVNSTVGWTVYWAVYGVIQPDSEHPALQELLRSCGIEMET